MKRLIILAACLLATGTFATVALAAEKIEGKWLTKSGETATITECGGDYCITVTTGKFAGRKIGKFSRTAEKYVGKITDPSNDNTYDGSGVVSGDALKLKGCVLMILCEEQIWKRL